MARHAFPNATEARREKIERELLKWFSWYDDGGYKSVFSWDAGPAYICDEVDNFLRNHDHYWFNERTGEDVPRRNRFMNQVSCCIRAGLDIACEPSAGVIGFTVGDLRRMYPRRLPKWVASFFDPPITADTPETAGVWL